MHLTFDQAYQVLQLVLDKLLALATLWVGYRTGHAHGERKGNGNEPG